MTVMKTTVSFVTTYKNKAMLKKLASRNNMTTSKYVEMLIAKGLQSK